MQRDLFPCLGQVSWFLRASRVSVLSNLGKDSRTLGSLVPRSLCITNKEKSDSTNNTRRWGDGIEKGIYTGVGEGFLGSLFIFVGLKCLMGVSMIVL